MSRPSLPHVLTACLLVAAAFAAWSWLKPYAWNPDEKARTKVMATLLTPDNSYFWLETHLKINPSESHDFSKPVRLITAAGKVHEPADTTFVGEDPLKPTAMWLKFWLEEADLAGALDLQINDGRLLIRSGSKVPDLGSASRNFTSHRW